MRLLEAGWISPPGDMLTDGASAGTADGQDLGLPTIGNGNDGGGLGGGGYLCHLPPEHRRTVNHNQIHYGSVYGVKTAPWGMGVPEVAVTGDIGPGGYAVGGKGVANIVDG